MRLIDVDALLADLRSLRSTACNHDQIVYLSAAISGIIADIARAPEVDAVPVVRCKDCKHNNGTCCTWHSGKDYEWLVDPEDYCSVGERR